MDPFIFQKGYCLECDQPIPPGQILCHKHSVQTEQVLAIVTKEIKISDMKEGDVGFTEEYAIFEANSKLFILGSAKISPQSEGYKTVRIELKHNCFEIDRTTINPEDIFLGIPETENHPQCFQAKLI